MRLSKPIVCVLCLCVFGLFVRAEHESDPIEYSGTLLVQLGVSDLDRSIDFYTDVMGFTLESRNDDLQWARLDPGIPDVTIGIGAKEDANAGNAISMNFGVEDIEAARATIESRGIQFAGPTIKVPSVVQLADLADPDGNRIRLAGHPPGYGNTPVLPINTNDKLDACSWLTGSWHGSHGTRDWEEHWSENAAGGIIGMFRMTDGDKLITYELVLIEPVDNILVFHLRHFGREMKAWEDESLTFELVESTDTLLLFKANTDQDGPTYIRYERIGDNKLDVWVGATAEQSDQGFSLPVTRQ